MDDQTIPSTPYSPDSEVKEIRRLVARILHVVAPSSMSAGDRSSWVINACEALADMRAKEIEMIMLEVQRSITRPNQIIPEIARLVGQRRERKRMLDSSPVISTGYVDETRIMDESKQRRFRARSHADVESAWQWERDERKAVGLDVAPIAPPLTRAELDAMPKHIRDVGLAAGHLLWRDGVLVERT